MGETSNYWRSRCPGRRSISAKQRHSATGWPGFASQQATHSAVSLPRSVSLSECWPTTKPRHTDRLLTFCPPSQTLSESASISSSGEYRPHHAKRRKTNGYCVSSVLSRNCLLAPVTRSSIISKHLSRNMVSPGRGQRGVK